MLIFIRLLLRMKRLLVVVIIMIVIIVYIIVIIIKVRIRVIYNGIIYKVVITKVGVVQEQCWIRCVDTGLGEQLTNATILCIDVEHVEPAVCACHQKTQILLYTIVRIDHSYLLIFLGNLKLLSTIPVYFSCLFIICS